jgi:TMEM175 potassium channel family protein
MHHGLTDGLDRVDSIFLRLNLLFLLAIAFLPFPTRLMVEGLERSTSWQRLAVVVYGLTLLLIRLLFAALGTYARREALAEGGCG